MAFRTLVMTRTTTEKIARPSKRASTLPNNVPASARERPDAERAGATAVPSTSEPPIRTARARWYRNWIRSKVSVSIGKSEHTGNFRASESFSIEHEGARMPTYRDFFADIKKRIHEATPEQVQDLIRSGDVQLGDVREKDEWNAGHIPGAVHVPKSYLEQWAEDRLPEKDKTTILYCAGGVRSAMAADLLQKLGYRNVISMAGGFNRWKDSGKPWTTPASFTPAKAQRYSRHLLIPQVGEAGQQKLLESKVLLIGAGGLGSPAAYYLASAGVGTLGIVDSDVVDLTNLQRQILQ